MEQRHEFLMVTCPFCGGEDIKELHDCRSDMYWVACQNIHCQACGPAKQSRDEAIESWNQRCVVYLFAPKE